ncbi:hypothetical protein Goshw_014036 [Gossypium schwendimanii]|uniref:Uncharacterized protein n=1 Tax=Gossypium schwendimanii TaxID=34291 RepID=A0A7J9MV42_GOSSC|nr:hypothetical protein [Gossypium schwendimanii]
MITSGFFCSSAASDELLEALCKSGNIPVAVRYLTRLQLKNDFTTYLMVIGRLSRWSERRTTNTTLALFANLIKKGLHPKTIYEYGEKEAKKRLEALN